MTGIISSFSCPLFVTSMLIFSHDPAFDALSDDIKDIAMIFFYLQVVQTLICVLLVFVPNYVFDPPTDWRGYNTTVPYIHYYSVIVIFYGFPFVYIGLYVYSLFTTDVISTFLGPYFALFLFVALPLMFWYDNTIHMVCE